MKFLLFCLFTLLLCLSAKKKHLVSQDEEKTCHYENCVECPESPYTCTKCADSFVLSKNGYCVNTVCTNGTYFNAEWEYCAGCGFKCTECSPEGKCLTCDEALGLTLNEHNQCVCKLGSFMSFKGGEVTCEKCVENCNECFMEHQCSKCQEGFAFDYAQSKCAQCQPGTFLHPEYGFCATCPIGCLQCTSYEECSQCDEANNFKFEEKTCHCPKGLFLEFPTTATGTDHKFVCSKCSENCLSCQGSSYCYECAEGFEVSNGQCVKKVSCEAGQYSVDGTCFPCLPNCGSCTESTTCTQCNEGFILNALGVCEAPSATTSERKSIEKKRKH